jgi:hypothetical protein
MVAIEKRMVRRTDDPLGEYREIILYQAEGSLHCVWEATGFLSDADVSFAQRQQLATGTRENMQQRFTEIVQGLCDDGFSVCERDSSAAIADKAQ